jgi:alkylation response protein AidB-like acyl-CoA dehydrogenase
MRFHLTTEQTAIQDSLKSALSDCYPKERLLALLDEDSDFDRRSWETLMELGLGSLSLTEEFGGSGLGLLESALAVETLGGAAAAGPVIGHLLTGMALAASGNAGARDAWLEGVAGGTAVAAVAFGGEWLPSGWEVELRDGKVSGNVPFVQGAGAAKLLLVGTRGAGLALVDTGGGVSVTPIKSTDRTRRLSAVRFDAAPAMELFAPGDPQVPRLFDAGLVLVAADALGGAQYCTDLSVAYAKEREQFGQLIGRFQSLKHQLANMALEVESARAMVWYAAYAHDAKLGDAQRAAALAKAHLCDRYVSVTRAAIAAHGGIGYTWEYGLNIWFRRAVFDRAYLGSPGVHRARAADLGGW